VIPSSTWPTGASHPLARSVVPGQGPNTQPTGYGGNRPAHGGAMSKELYFSLQGVDINDETALEAFVHQIWQQATREFTGQEANSPEDPADPSNIERKSE